jgi:hypothetical protein
MQAAVVSERPDSDLVIDGFLGHVPMPSAS